MKILISGAGIAGPTLAYWLLRFGFEPTLVESAPQLRTGGYIVDFWGVGFELAERMGLRPELEARGFKVREVRAVDRNGSTVGTFAADVFVRASQDRYISLPRGDLAAAIYALIDGRVETIFGDSIAQLEQGASRVRVTFERGDAREFDLVIGADGLHSRVRTLAFGPEEHFEKFLGYGVAAFKAPGYRPRDELVYMTHTEVGRQISRFAMRDYVTMFLFVFRDASGKTASAHTREAQQVVLREEFSDVGWECPRILEALAATDDLYFDRVSQIRMGDRAPRWSRGRVALVGDAGACISFLGGEGSGLGMTEAYVLAGELGRARGDYSAAFARYEERLAPFIVQKQDAAERFGGAFAPRTRLGLHVRNWAMNLLHFPWIADLAIGANLRDDFKLPDYTASDDETPRKEPGSRSERIEIRG